MTNYKILDTEAEAIAMCAEENATGSYYKRKNHKAHYTPWDSGNYHGFIVWYVDTTGVCPAAKRR